MRESCSCGAAIHTMFYSRVLTWRMTHTHGDTIIDATSITSLPTGFTIVADYDDEEE